MSETEEKKPEEKPLPKVDVRDLTPAGAEKDKDLRFTKRFHVTWRTDDGDVLEGDFTVKRTNIGEQARVGVIMAELREDKPVDSIDRGTLQCHEWIAMCTVSLTVVPPWWNPTEMYELDVLKRVYEEALAFQNTFRKKRVVERPGATP